MADAVQERLAIRELVENWAVWRDAGDWERFRTVWHDDGRMMATWFQGTADEFIRVTKEGWDKGVSILHFLGGSSIDVAGHRAIAQTKMTISQRADVDGVRCDVVCNGRFYDFIEKRDGRWGVVLRQPIYEKDRLDPLDPAAKLALDRGLLAFVLVRSDERAGDVSTGQALAREPEVLEVHHVAGQDSYLVKVRVKDPEALGRLLRERFGAIPSVRATQSTIALETMKESWALPVESRPKLEKVRG